MTTTPPSSEDMKTTILGRITAGDISMRPRWFFVLRGVLIGVGVTMLLLFVPLLLSFLFFTLRETGLFWAPNFGPRGIGLFAVSFPWMLLVLSVLFVIVLEILVRRFSFAYRRPLLLSLAVILGISFAGSALVLGTKMHERLADPDRPPLPILAPFYGAFREPSHPPVVVGRVLSSSTTSDGARAVVLFSRRDGTTTLSFDDDVVIDPAVHLEEGEAIAAYGEWDGTTFHAFGARPFFGVEMPRGIKRGDMMPRKERKEEKKETRELVPSQASSSEEEE